MLVVRENLYKQSKVEKKYINLLPYFVEPRNILDKCSSISIDV